MVDKASSPTGAPITQLDEAIDQDEVLRQAAQEQMSAEQWSAAAQTLALVRHRDGQVQMLQRLCANLAALQAHRPQVYRAIAGAGVADCYQIIGSRTGLATIAIRTPDGKLTSLSANNDPAGSVRQILAQLSEVLQKGSGLGIAGIGDGYLLAQLAKLKIDYFLGRQQSVHIFEPDPRLLLACCMLHDFAGDDGPIAQRRFHWYIGPEWFDQFRHEMLSDHFLPFPGVNVQQGVVGKAVAARVTTMLGELGTLDDQHGQAIAEHYDAMSRDRLLAALRGEGGRKPRVMLLTTRFSTVLQYSTRDTAAAFEQLGWESLVHIEPSPHHMPNRLALRGAIARFLPDLVFQIDHLRHEHEGLIPPQVPFVCWVQDNLPNLTDATAAAKVNAREFVLIPSVQRYVKQYGYPVRQCMEFRKLSRAVPLPATWESDGDDLVYVSNWSRSPETVADEMVADLSSLVPATTIRDCCEQLIAIYRRGGQVSTPGEIRAMVDPLRLAPDVQLTLTNQLFERINNVLYRQQALAWAADVAERHGLSLAIYGNGWERSERFARYARGVAAYGEHLESITRQAKINLVLEPYVCISHQRLLDGLLAGGFFLVRSHPTSHMLQGLIDLLKDHDSQIVRDVSTARAALRGRAQHRFETLLAASAAADATPQQFDVVAAVRSMQQSEFLPVASGILPRLDEVSFDTPQELMQRVQQFLLDDGARMQIMKQQRAVVEQQFTYVAGLRRAIAFIEQRIAEEQGEHHA